MSSPTPPPSKKEDDDYTPPPWAFAAAILVLGSSAGLTMYTKRTGSMLKQMERVRSAQVKREGPVKFGPPTKKEWDRMRPRLDDDDLF